MGVNEWRKEWEWPARAHPDSSATTCTAPAGRRPWTVTAPSTPHPPGAEPPDVFLYRPNDPVPTCGGGLCCHAPQVPYGAFDQREVERRSDVLVYTSAVLDTPVEVTGPVTRDPLRRILRARHRLHRQARRCRPLRARRQPQRRHHPRPLPATPPRGLSRSHRERSTSTTSISGPPATSSFPAIASAWRSPAATTRDSTASEHGRTRAQPGRSATRDPDHSP